MSLSPLVNALRRSWNRRLEQHYLMSAACEQKKAKEANANAAYYQRKAALARANTHL